MAALIPFSCSNVSIILTVILRVEDLFSVIVMK